MLYCARKPAEGAEYIAHGACFVPAVEHAVFAFWARPVMAEPVGVYAVHEFRKRFAVSVVYEVAGLLPAAYGRRNCG